VADWKIDFSRRTKKHDSVSSSGFSYGVDKKSLFDFSSSESMGPTQELVVLNTKNGFIPSNIRVKVGKRYKLTIVNVNEQVRNISFVLDAFSEHHSTYYGIVKSFVIKPKKEGVYAYQCPETSAQGKLIVYSDSHQRLRSPASEE